MCIRDSLQPTGSRSIPILLRGTTLQQYVTLCQSTTTVKFRVYCRDSDLRANGSCSPLPYTTFLATRSKAIDYDEACPGRDASVRRLLRRASIHISRRRKYEARQNLRRLASQSRTLGRTTVLQRTLRAQDLAGAGINYYSGVLLLRT